MKSTFRSHVGTVVVLGIMFIWAYALYWSFNNIEVILSVVEEFV